MVLIFVAPMSAFRFPVTSTHAHFDVSATAPSDEYQTCPLASRTNTRRQSLASTVTETTAAPLLAVLKLLTGISGWFAPGCRTQSANTLSFFALSFFVPA